MFGFLTMRRIPLREYERAQEEIMRLSTRCEDLRRGRESLKRENTKLSNQIEEESNKALMLTRERDRLRHRLNRLEDLAHELTQQFPND